MSERSCSLHPLHISPGSHRVSDLVLRLSHHIHAFLASSYIQSCLSVSLNQRHIVYKYNGDHDRRNEQPPDMKAHIYMHASHGGARARERTDIETAFDVEGETLLIRRPLLHHQIQCRHRNPCAPRAVEGVCAFVRVFGSVRSCLTSCLRANFVSWYACLSALVSCRTAVEVCARSCASPHLYLSFCLRTCTHLSVSCVCAREPERESERESEGEGVSKRERECVRK